MQRRDFLKISAAGGAAAALEGCGNPDHQLIRFIPEEDMLPGIATWKPSICTLCPAGCGTLVRVMQGEAEVVRNGQLGILKMGLAKKIEGNPAHPINQGRLCPRGHAALQVTYHPDRIKTPLQRTGPRGSGQFKETTWDEALKQLVSQLSPLLATKQKESLTFLTAPLTGERKTLARNFASAFGGSAIEFEFLDHSVFEQANYQSFGIAGMPTVDFGQTNYVISFGADFLGTWNSPVAQSIGYGQMRKGHPGQRGKFVQFESRVSQTGASADEWIACPPATEGALALSVAYVILNEKLRPANAASAAGAAIGGWAAGLPDYAPDKIEKQIGVSAATIVRIAREAAATSPAVVLIGDPATAQTNGLASALAVNALNVLLGSAGKPGGIEFSPFAHEESVKTSIRDLAQQIVSGSGAPKVLLLHNANPMFSTPPSWRVKDALDMVAFVVSFGSFVDETSILADLILPDNSPLESWLDGDAKSGTTRAASSIAAPVMNPLHNTRSMPDVLLGLAQQLGGDVAKALPWKTYEDALKASVVQGYKKKAGYADADDFWNKTVAAGGSWSNVRMAPPILVGKNANAAVKNVAPQFDGNADKYPFHFLPFASQMFYDGSLAHLPWMQEAPDPLSSVMWGTWVEINNRTAEKLGVGMGDTVEVASQHGKLQAPALVTPTIAPDVIAMPIGQGHENFTRYASGRGANPISILAPMTDSVTGSLAWAATRVKISRIGEGKIVMFGASLTEQSPELKHR